MVPALKKNGPQAIGKSRGGWTTKIPLVAASDRCAITFRLSPGQDHEAPAGRQLMIDFGPVAPFDKLDVMFSGFIYFALIVDALRMC
jgi:hypothetical protein